MCACKSLMEDYFLRSDGNLGTKEMRAEYSMQKKKEISRSSVGICRTSECTAIVLAIYNKLIGRKQLEVPTSVSQVQTAARSSDCNKRAEVIAHKKKKNTGKVIAIERKLKCVSTKKRKISQVTILPYAGNPPIKSDYRWSSPLILSRLESGQDIYFSLTWTKTRCNCSPDVS